MFEILIAAAVPGQAPPAWIQWLPHRGHDPDLLVPHHPPQMRRQKEHAAKVASLKKGDEVITAGGLVGKVIRVDDTYAELELGQNVRVRAVKTTIGDIIPPGGKAPKLRAND
jgi:preprotein translocase subunit YajC